MKCRRKKMCSGSLRHRITLERRSLTASSPGSAEAEYTYTTFHTCRANIKTKGGVSEFNKIEVDGTKVSHVVTIRHTKTVFDTRDRLRDASGNLYTILSIENSDEYDDQLVLYCANQGAETRRAAL
ncbi:MAG: head-tail adaptor protein [Filomicrobium sp.]